MMNERARSRVGVVVAAVLVMSLLLVAVAGPLYILDLPNQAHADEVHEEAAAARDDINNGRCDELRTYYSQSRGTALFLCVNHGAGEWAGRLIRVSDSSGRPYLPEQVYECTVFAGPPWYWKRTIKRDGYVRGLPSEVQAVLDIVAGCGVEE